tara:strand:+ start:570 stop:1652 length:1083 start_codon:yes stop_codon:yes gene_type:complete
VDKFEIDCLIIGGGVAGLASAKYLSNKFKKIFLIEKNNHLGMETSSRNSEVVHAGIYYKKDSLKSKFCLKGKYLLYDYLLNNNISFLRCGKYIVSTNQEESEKLEKIRLNAVECGLEDLNYEKSLKKTYPFLKVLNSIFSPSSGIFDSHSFLKSLESDFVSNGGQVLLGNKCKDISDNDQFFEVLVSDQNNNLQYIFKTKHLINAAGIASSNVANMIDKSKKFDTQLIKGEYYSYKGKEKLNHLIYPIPSKYSLGLHATIDLGKGIRFGPSAIETDSLDYEVEIKNKINFINSIKKYWPNIDENNLHPDYSGIRAKIRGKEDFSIDKIFSKEKIAINIVGYISPGLTSSLALGEYIEKYF